ncbi:hypothetical protein [Methanobrevibacter sp.]
MKTKNIILIAIAILVIALVGVAAYSVINNQPIDLNATSSNNTNNTTKFINIGTINANDTNKTVVGDNSTLNLTNLTNKTVYKVYVPQTDSYVPVIGEKFDDEVNRWYTYDAEGVRYYNTRINH